MRILDDTISDMIGDLLYYDRKEDEELPIGAIEQAIRDGVISEEDIVTMFRHHLAVGLKRLS